MSNNCQASTHQKHPLSRGMATDTPSCDLSGSGNSPIDYCYQCSTLNNSNALMTANHNRVVPGGGIESQCSSIESNCQGLSQSNTMSGGVKHLQKVTGAGMHATVLLQPKQRATLESHSGRRERSLQSMSS